MTEQQPRERQYKEFIPKMLKVTNFTAESLEGLKNKTPGHIKYVHKDNVIYVLLSEYRIIRSTEHKLPGSTIEEIPLDFALLSEMYKQRSELNLFLFKQRNEEQIKNSQLKTRVILHSDSRDIATNENAKQFITQAVKLADLNECADLEIIIHKLKFDVLTELEEQKQIKDLSGKVVEKVDLIKGRYQDATVAFTVKYEQLESILKQLDSFQHRPLLAIVNGENLKEERAQKHQKRNNRRNALKKQKQIRNHENQDQEHDQKPKDNQRRNTRSNENNDNQRNRNNQQETQRPERRQRQPRENKGDIHIEIEDKPSQVTIFVDISKLPEGTAGKLIPAMKDQIKGLNIRQEADQMVLKISKSGQEQVIELIKRIKVNSNSLKYRIQ